MRKHLRWILPVGVIAVVMLAGLAGTLMRRPPEPSAPSPQATPLILIGTLKGGGNIWEGNVWIVTTSRGEYRFILDDSTAVYLRSREGIYQTDQKHAVLAACALERCPVYSVMEASFDYHSGRLIAIVAAVSPQVLQQFLGSATPMPLPSKQP